MPSPANLHANKVPQITLAFWVMKICATTLGETAGDLLSMTLNVGYGVSTLILLGLFVVTLVCQLAAKSYHPFLYWTVILSTSTAGTTMSDYMDRTLGVGYAAGSLILVTILASILALWRLTVGTFPSTTSGLSRSSRSIGPPFCSRTRSGRLWVISSPTVQALVLQVGRF